MVMTTGSVGAGGRLGAGRFKPTDIEAQHEAGDVTQMQEHAKEVAVEGADTITEVPPPKRVSMPYQRSRNS